MNSREITCKACDGDGLLMDDEEWQYTCKVCGGSGTVSMNEPRNANHIADVDENNRILD